MLELIGHGVKIEKYIISPPVNRRKSSPVQGGWSLIRRFLMKLRDFDSLMRHRFMDANLPPFLPFPPFPLAAPPSALRSSVFWSRRKKKYKGKEIDNRCVLWQSLSQLASGPLAIFILHARLSNDDFLDPFLFSTVFAKKYAFKWSMLTKEEEKKYIFLLPSLSAQFQSFRMISLFELCSKKEKEVGSLLILFYGSIFQRSFRRSWSIRKAEWLHFSKIHFCHG